MKLIIAMLSVLCLSVIAMADTTTVNDNLVAQRIDTLKEHVDYPVWRVTSDSVFKRFDVIAIRVLWRRQGGTTVIDTTMKWRPTNTAVNTDSVKAFFKFNTTK